MKSSTAAASDGRPRLGFFGMVDGYWSVLEFSEKIGLGAELGSGSESEEYDAEMRVWKNLELACWLMEKLGLDLQEKLGFNEGLGTK